MKLCVSACLLGKNVRYDGANRFEPDLKNHFGKYFEFIEICPEVESGFPVPRNPMRLEGNLSSLRLVIKETGEDVTGRMLSWARKKADILLNKDIWGFIFKSGSPSCGVKDVKIHSSKKDVLPNNRGIFTRLITDLFPFVPVEDEKSLRNPAKRNSFIERVFVHARWSSLLENEKKLENLLDFHKKHTPLLLTYDSKIIEKMNLLIARKKNRLSSLYDDYFEMLKNVLELKNS